jgi:hypothetical protein
LTGLLAEAIVPARQRLVVETISGAANAPAGQRPALLTVSTKVNQFIANAFPASEVFSLLSSDDAIDFYTYATPLKMCADPGTKVLLDCNRGAGGSFTGELR